MFTSIFNINLNVNQYQKKIIFIINLNVYFYKFELVKNLVEFLKSSRSNSNLPTPYCWT